MNTCKSVRMIILSFLVLISSAALATTYYVDPGGSDDANGLSWATAFATIQKGIKEANDGNISDYAVVYVNSGTYLTGPIHFYDNNVKVIFKENVEVLARSNYDLNEPNLFAGTTACLVQAINKENIIIDGNNTVLRMRKSEYTSGEWRMVINLWNCTNVSLKSLILKDSGGDGIYIGQYEEDEAIACKDISIENVTCDNNYRNGISVVSVDGLTIENCVIKNTNGAPAGPWAGIDFEPNWDYELLKNINVRNIRMEDNKGSGVTVTAWRLDSDPNDISITCENLYIRGGDNAGIQVVGIGDSNDHNGPDGLITFSNVTVEDANRGAWIWKSYSKAGLVFNNCVWKNSAEYAVLIDDRWYIHQPGGVDFNDCQVFENADRPAIIYSGGEAIYDIHGDIYVQNDLRSTNLYDWNGAQPNDVDVDVNSGIADFCKAYNRTQNRWHATIQAAIDDANNNDLIEIQKCTHYESIDFGGKAITLQSTDPNDWDVVAATIIDANDSGDAVTFSNSEDANSVLRGFIIQGSSYNGIVCSNGATPIIKNCIVSGGKGIDCAGSGTAPVISNNIVKDCDIGIWCRIIASPVIKNNLIYDNGNGILTSAAGVVEIKNNTIVNSANCGIQVLGIEPVISNCIIWDCNDDLYNCSATYSCIEDSFDSNDPNFVGSINSNPCFVAADANDFHLIGLSPCIDSGDPNENCAGQVDIDGQARLVDGRVDMGADERQGYETYGMEIESVSQDSNGITVITTGARYVLNGTGIKMYRRIDPNTNSINEREVAELAFDADIGSLSIEFFDTRRALVDSDKATFDFQSDSLFFVTAKEDVNVTHTNLIANAPWNAPLDPDERDLDRMWTDGYGGSLLASISQATAGSVISEDVDFTTVSLLPGDETAHMVYPAKPFDFNGLYGTNARPFMYYLFNTTEMNDFVNNTNNFRQNLVDDGFGVIMLWNAVYTNSHTPQLLDSDPDILGYNVSDPNYVKNIINVAHANEFKIIAYLLAPAHSYWDYEEQHQDIAVTLNWMKNFQEEYGFDGWYFDNANVSDDVIDDYDFIRQVRTDIGINGIIYHHDSVDVWATGTIYGGYSGLRAIMVDAYANYALTGETGTIAEIDYPNDPYLRFYTAGYGLSQAYASHKRKNNGSMSLSEEEKNRIMAENLNGCECGERSRENSWINSFKPFYDIRKTEYLNDPNHFDPDVDWPIDPNNGWFRMPTSISVTDINSNSTTITWTTNENSDSEVTYTSTGYWWASYYGDPNAPDGSVSDSNLVTEHSITLTGLDSNTPYEFKIRSSNGQSVVNEIIWGYVGSFTTKTCTVNFEDFAAFANLWLETGNDLPFDFDDDNDVDAADLKWFITYWLSCCPADWPF